jgi:hypothetical protein
MARKSLNSEIRHFLKISVAALRRRALGLTSAGLARNNDHSVPQYFQPPAFELQRYRAQSTIDTRMASNLAFNASAERTGKAAAGQ